MTNWKQFRIYKIELEKNQFKEDYINLHLDSFEAGVILVTFNTSGNVIQTKNCYPFRTYQVGDILEIDLDRARDYHYWYKPRDVDAESIIRKISSTAVVPSSFGGLTISTTPSSTAEVARTVTQTILDHADRTGGTPQIEIETNKINIWYHPPKK